MCIHLNIDQKRESTEHMANTFRGVLYEARATRQKELHDVMLHVADGVILHGDISRKTFSCFLPLARFFSFVVCSSSFSIAVSFSHVLLFCFQLDYFYQSGAKCQHSICCLCGFFTSPNTLQRYVVQCNPSLLNQFSALSFSLTSFIYLKHLLFLVFLCVHASDSIRIKEVQKCKLWKCIYSYC